MRALVTSTICLIAFVINAQSTRTSLVDALKAYESSLSITFSYDTELLSQVDVNGSYDTENFDVFLKQIENELPFKVTQVDEKYFTIAAKETTYAVMVRDSIDNSFISNQQKVQVLINRAPIESSYNDGKLVFDYKPRAENVVEVFSDGYMPSVVSLKQLVNQSNIEISLGLRTKYLGTVVIEDYLTKGINLNPSNQHIKINTEDLPLLPGDTDGDIFASIAALPGITTPDGRAGNLFIRGSETDQSLIVFDNIPIYHRGHYYGTISPYNPKIVKNVEVYRSGFHPRLGERAGGAILINSDQPTSIENPKLGLGANTLFGTAYGKVPLGNKWGVSFSARRSYSREFTSPKLEAISESVFDATALVGANGKLTTKLNVLFEDYLAKISFAPASNHQLSFTALYTHSDTDYSPPIRPNLSRRFVQNEFYNTGFSLEWKYDLSKKWRSDFLATFSEFDFRFEINDESPPRNFFSKNNLKDINLRQEFSRSGKLADLQLGVDYKRQEVATGYRNVVVTRGDSLLYDIDDKVQSHSLSPFMNLNFYGLDRWYLQFGIRSTYYSTLDDFRVSPRLLVNYDLTRSATLKASTGIYNQYLSQVKNLEFGGGGFDNELWTLADGESGFIINGNQSMAGIVMDFNKWVIDIETFYKEANNITVYEDRSLNPNSTYFTMDQQTQGIDILVKKEITENTSLWMGYSYHDSKIKLDTTDQANYSSKFVQPHVWYAGGAWSKGRWKMSAGWKYASGLNAKSLDIIYAQVLYQRQVDQNPGNPPPNPFENLNDRYPNVYQLDVSASYSIPRTDTRKWNASFGLSIINVLNRENLTDRAFRGRNGFIDRNAIGFAPNLMMIFEW